MRSYHTETVTSLRWPHLNVQCFKEGNNRRERRVTHQENGRIVSNQTAVRGGMGLSDASEIATVLRRIRCLSDSDPRYRT
ncbi:hypothetical protein BCR33DRAFT_722246 [Rhizoclosmatium globosum]|uniref:Uncharacterized protein n=1 Tax=Rhizoclosmatium globosum TaxID=329046 RepID=A0A1Y2BN51_9FUNG|nr:hypothetical protein BCR33DRAFT_722246 [Rhizoclosmatium globosum]|eukprot:ORY36150.1 hypothetical protein BCR33DRAFT_722246 [Rhizoclosmatium globosum]